MAETTTRTTIQRLTDTGEANGWTIVAKPSAVKGHLANLSFTRGEREVIVFFSQNEPVDGLVLDGEGDNPTQIEFLKGSNVEGLANRYLTEVV
jgi:hypothetical protein